MNAGIDTRRLRALAGMGIDVWVRRHRVASVPSAEAAPATRERQRATVRETPAPRREAASPTPTPSAAVVDAPTTWTAIAVGRVVLIARCDTPQDRRFAQDLVLAVAGYPQDAPTLVTFVPTRAAGDETAAFARGQIDRRRAECAIVSRSAAAALALPVDDAVEIGVTKLNGARCFVVAELAALRSNPDAKRNLWRALSQRG
jgi:hypothetical protein